MKNKKKGVLDKVYYELGKQQVDFHVAGTWTKDGERLFTKWKKYSEAVMPVDFDGTAEDWKDEAYFSQINQRQILPNELVLDLEEPERIKEIVDKLKTLSIDSFSVWKTGSRGFHIHIFSDKPIKETTKEFITQTLGTDVQKCSEKCLIALENCPHWKTGKPKTDVTEEYYE